MRDAKGPQPECFRRSRKATCAQRLHFPSHNAALVPFLPASNEVYASIDRSEAGTKVVPGPYPLKVSLNLKASAAWGRAGTWKSS